MSVALAPELWEEVRAAADRAGKSPDDWFADAAEAKLRVEEDAAALEEAARTRLAVAAGEEGGPVNALVLDAGALIAIDRDDRDVHKTVRDAHRMGVQVLTNSMAVAQVWRDS